MLLPAERFGGQFLFETSKTMIAFDYAPDLIERGRLLFARPFMFTKGCVRIADLPPMDKVEIAFAGRSNVGKSSLINALCGTSSLARTSNTPGRTQELNIFESQSENLRIVDMPGYGYAKAPEDKVRAWTKLIHQYLTGRATLRRVYVLVDGRHGPKDNDLTVMNELDKAAVSYQVVLTKADKPSEKELEGVIAATQAAIAKRPAAHPRVILTSSVKGDGLRDLRAEIAQLLET